MTCCQVHQHLGGANVAQNKLPKARQVSKTWLSTASTKCTAAILAVKIWQVTQL
jgi:hypothetical protein